MPGLELLGLVELVLQDDDRPALLAPARPRSSAGSPTRTAAPCSAPPSGSAPSSTRSSPCPSSPPTGPVVAVNAAVGETIGWPDLVRTVARVEHRLPGWAHAVILTRNYGEAGAIDRYGPALGLPHAYSGHNAYGEWGPPPNGAAPVITVGLGARQAAISLRGCALAARIHNAAGIDNDEEGQPVMLCQGPRRSWSAEWPALRHLG